MINSQGNNNNKKPNRCQYHGDTDVEFSEKGFNAAIITVVYEVNINTLN